MNPLPTLWKKLLRQSKHFRREASPGIQPTNTTLLKGNLDMENDIPTKEQTGGLKLMTVFIVVLALHVFVIGGISVYHLFKGDSRDATTAQNNMPEVKTKKEGDAAQSSLEAPSVDLAAPAPINNGAAGVEVAADINAPAMSAESNATPTVAQAEIVGSHTVVDDVIPAPIAPVVMNNANAVSKAVSTYKVKAGDNLGKIAKNSGMTVAELKRINSLKNDVIRVGQILKTNGSAERVTSVAANTPAMKVKTVSMATPSRAKAVSYKVNSGDTLIKIAKKFNTTPAAIMASNKMTDANKLKVGANLNIPLKGDRKSLTDGSTQPVIQQTASASPDLVMNR
jgi:LysM repeat protein